MAREVGKRDDSQDHAPLGSVAEQSSAFNRPFLQLAYGCLHARSAYTFVFSCIQFTNPLYRHGYYCTRCLRVGLAGGKGHWFQSRVRLEQRWSRLIRIDMPLACYDD
jgi:hypothetical protein